MANRYRTTLARTVLPLVMGQLRVMDLLSQAQLGVFVLRLRVHNQLLMKQAICVLSSSLLDSW